jgi:importin subunit alpha-1
MKHRRSEHGEDANAFGASSSVEHPASGDIFAAVAVLKELFDNEAVHFALPPGIYPMVLHGTFSVTGDNASALRSLIESGHWTSARLTAMAEAWQYSVITEPELVPLRLLPVFAEMANSGDPSVMFHGVLMVRKLLSVDEDPPVQAVVDSDVVPQLVSLLSRDDWVELQCEAGWAISCICETSLDCIQPVLQAEVMERLIAMLTSPSVAVQTLGLSTILNIAADNETLTQVLIDHGALPAFHFLLNHPRRATKHEACWCLRNIAARSIDKIQAIMSADLYPVILQLMDAPEYDVKKEAVRCVANTTSGGTKEQLRYLVGIGVLLPLCRVLTSVVDTGVSVRVCHSLTLIDPTLVAVALEALANCLQLGVDDMKEQGLSENPIASLVEHCGGLELIQTLEKHKHQSPELYNHALTVIKTYFSTRLK